MRGPKRTKTEYEKGLAEVARLDRRGMSVREIGAVICVNYRQVLDDLKIVRERYFAATMAEHARELEQIRRQYRNVQAAAWAEWDRSKPDAVNKTTDEPLANTVG